MKFKFIVRATGTFIFFLILAGCSKTVYNQLAEPWEPDYKLDRFEATIRKYEEEEKTSPAVKDAIVLTGSSSFTMWKQAAQDLSPLPVLNRGFGGSTLPEVIYYLDRTVLKHQPSAIVVYCENDMFGKKPKTPEQTRDAYVKLTELIRKRYPKVAMYYVSMKPSPSRWGRRAQVEEANRLIKEFVEKDVKHRYIDVTKVMMKDGRPDGRIFLKDSLHMNAEGYKRWTGVLKPALTR
jgi:lysophospholipase L1-like esterase